MSFSFSKYVLSKPRHPFSDTRYIITTIFPHKNKHRYNILLHSYVTVCVKHKHRKGSNYKHQGYYTEQDN
jgi:hypothetical protein